MNNKFFEFRENFLIDDKIREVKELYNGGEFDQALSSIKSYIGNLQVSIDEKTSQDFYCFTKPIESFLFLKYSGKGDLRLLPFKGDLSSLYSLYGAILNSYGDRDNAIEKYLIAYNLNPYNVINLVRIATYYFNDDLDKSWKFLEDSFRFAADEESLEMAYKGLRGYYIEKGNGENVAIIDEILKGEGLENLNVDVPLGYSSIIRQVIYEMAEIAKAENDSDGIEYCDKLLDRIEADGIGNIRKKEKVYKTTTLDDF